MDFIFYFFIPKICRISRSHSFQCCLPYCFKGVISICMIATVHKSLVLTGFLQHDVEKNFCKKRGEKSHCEGLLYDSSCQSRLIFFFFFLVKCFHANFSFLPQGKGYYNQHFLLSLCVGGKKHTHQTFRSGCCHKVGVLDNRSHGGRKRADKMSEALITVLLGGGVRVWGVITAK